MTEPPDTPISARKLKRLTVLAYEHSARLGGGTIRWGERSKDYQRKCRLIVAQILRNVGIEVEGSEEE